MVMFTRALTRKCLRLARIVVGWHGYEAAECPRLVTMSHEYAKSATSGETNNGPNALNQGGQVFTQYTAATTITKISCYSCDRAYLIIKTAKVSQKFSGLSAFLGTMISGAQP